MRRWSWAVVVVIMAGSASSAWAGAYSEWQPSAEYAGFEYRVKYVRLNEFKVKDGKSPHDWCFEVRNSHQAKASFRFAITDANAEAPAKDKWGRADVEPGKTKESCINFLDTPEGGRPRVWLDKVTVDGKEVPLPCDLGAVTVEPLIALNGEIKVLRITHRDEKITLSRASLLALSRRSKPPKADKATMGSDGAAAPDDLEIEIGGAGSPKILLSVLEQEFCGKTTPSTPGGQRLNKLRTNLEGALQRATQALCEKEKDPAACLEKLRKKTHISGGVKG